MDYNLALSYALAGDAIFLIGSGFSVGSTNQMGLPLMTGKKLAEDLSNKVGLDNDTPLEIVAQEYIDFIGEHSLAKYLKENYYVDKYCDFYNAFAKIKDLKIYSTNYDNLVESICKTEKKKIKSYILSEKINKADKKNMIMHLNGYVEDITDEIPGGFNLTHLSYNQSPLYNSPWYPYLKEEIRSIGAIFIIGLSFKSDLDLRRLIALESEITEKCFIIESPTLSDNDYSYFSKYGHVIKSGIEQFCNDLNNAKPVELDNSISSYKFKSFKELKIPRSYRKPNDKEIFSMFFLGDMEKDVFNQDENGKFVSLINRSKLSEALLQIQSGKSIIVHSDLGNGKTMFLNELLCKLFNVKVFKMQSKTNDKILKEIEILSTSEEKVIIVVDPYNLYLKDIEKFKNYKLNNIQFIFMARTAMHENCSNYLYEVIDMMQNINLSTNPINLNVLDDVELKEFNNIIANYGFWGEQTRLSDEEKLLVLKNKLKSRMQNILLYLFEKGQIKEKFEIILQSIAEDKLLLRILIISFINEILELNLDIDDYNTIFNKDNIDRIIRRRREDLGELIEYNSDRLRIKSAIISKSLIASKTIKKEDVLEALLLIANRLDALYDGNQKYKDALKNICSASYLSFIFDYTLDSNILIAYYEKIKENKSYKNNLFFWEQYAITCVNIHDFARAKKYFETSYSLAKKRGKTFSSFQIDNHYARYLLESQIYSRNYETALKAFVEAHKLLTKKYINDDKINDRFYQFKVAIIYKEYYDVFYNSLSDEDKKIFITRCNEMYQKLQAYMKMKCDNDFKQYIYECERNLKYIMETAEQPI